MTLTETTQLPDAALPLAPFRAHLRMGTGFGDDTLQDEVLLAFLRASLAAIEARTGKVLLARAFQWQTESWGTTAQADGASAPLPVAPVSAVSELAIVPLTGAETVVDVAAYRLVADAQAPKLAAVGAALPVIPTGGAARVTLTAGMAPDWEGLPADLRQAVLMLAAHYYEYREDRGLDAGCMPFGVSALLSRYRRLRLSFGGAA
ncbi:Phage gp6-like head-tail connector protein [Tritonibacter multivorans]|uniref:Phage gp6-like head-tail connector protein n=1 Tax=Tritonibacter multivorans TaxID=928856 RepID=A0A0P1GIE8_9RHOB|nr:head-tail connector protein [Tritonibacter multivorans]MDA7420429.1 head-tail connector protein [Tritonibacter multivorans]CUH81624.1 Phage gp6-like head-tail connector protein [Tritonibacter multivorans]SFC39528.1 phage conserved hypothetical protein, phiE125 gp8 family [Tritonibacter multivorans]